MSATSRITKVPFLDKIYPTKRPLKDLEADILIRSATFICSTYAYRRLLLASDAFEFVKLGDVSDLPFFKKDHQRAAAIRQSLSNITEPLKNKQVACFYFAVLNGEKDTDVKECLRFSFDYRSSSMEVYMPNAITVRVESRWNFADDLVDVLDKVRLLCDYLGDIPKDCKCAVMLHCKRGFHTSFLPSNFKLQPYDPIEKSLETLPIAYFPCNENNFLMTVELRSAYFDVDAYELDDEVEKARRLCKKRRLEQQPSSDESSQEHSFDDNPVSPHSPKIDETSNQNIEADSQGAGNSGFVAETPTDSVIEVARHETVNASNSLSSVDSLKRSFSSLLAPEDCARAEPVVQHVNQMFYHEYKPLDLFSVNFSDVFDDLLTTA